MPHPRRWSSTARPKLAAVAATAALVGALAACSSGSGTKASGSGSSTAGNGSSATSVGAGATGTVSLGYAGGGNIDVYYKQVIAAAEKAMPGITVKPVVYSTYDDQLNQMPQQLAAHTIPDVIVWDNSAPVAQYAQEGAIKPLGDLVSAQHIDLKAFPSSLVKSWTVNGQLYGIPSYLQNFAYVFNAGLLGQAGITSDPTTMQQVARDAKQVKARTGKAGVVLLDNLFHLTQYVLAFGGGWGDGKTIDSAQNKAGLQYLVDLFNSGAAVTPNKVGATWDGEALGDNKAAMSDGGPWYIGFMQSSAPKVKYALKPVPSATGAPPFVVTYGGSYSITSNAKNVPAAQRLIAYLTNEQSEKAIVTTKDGFVPARTTEVQAYRAQNPQYASITNALLNDGKTLDYPTKTVQFGNALVAGFENIVFRHQGSVSSLLQTLQSQYSS